MPDYRPLAALVNELWRAGNLIRKGRHMPDTVTAPPLSAVLSEGLARDVARARSLLAVRTAEARARATADDEAVRQALAEAVRAAIPEKLIGSGNYLSLVGAHTREHTCVLRVPGCEAITTTFERSESPGEGPCWRQRLQAGHNDGALVTEGDVVWCVPLGEENLYAASLADALALAQLDENEPPF